MFSTRYVVCVLFGGAVVLAAAAGDNTLQGGKGGKEVAKPKKAENEVIQEFPSNGEMETAWKVEWTTQRGNGLIIKGAWFKRNPKDRWIQILGDARVAEIFVPYHRGEPRFWDVRYQFRLCTATKDDAGPFGKLLRDRDSDRPTVIQEIRDRGLIWKDHTGSRRGQALVLWGCLEAANYRYIMEYGFQDDGAVTFRLGSTGRNFGGSEYEPHMHNALWRVNVNLDGSKNNSVYTVEHVEPLPQARTQARTDVKPFNGGKEGFFDWTAEKFTMLRVVNDKVKTARGDPLAYDLMSQRWGNGRHHGGERDKEGKSEEDCTHHDFWVTKAKSDELEYTELPKYVADGEKVMNTDVVLWHSAPMHHEPRLEDGKMAEGGSGIQGCTHVVWSCFVLKPRNLFEQTPLYPYDKAPSKRRPR